MFFPIRTDRPLHAWPWMNWILIAANLFLFLIQSTHPGFQEHYMLYPNSPTLWGYLTYAFLHSADGPVIAGHAISLHLLGNMMFLWTFGNNVNDRMGHVGYLAFYLGAAVFAGIGFVLTQGNGSPVLGASGAVAAVTGAYLVMFPRSYVTIAFWAILFFQSFEVSSVAMIVLFFVIDVFYGVAGLTNAGAGGVAHTAHIGGSLFGFAVTLVLVATNLLPRDPTDLLALVRRWNNRRAYKQMVAEGYNPFEPALASPGAGGVFQPEAEEDPAAKRVRAIRGEIAEAIQNANLPGAAALYLRMRALDPNQVLARQAQLDVATQLADQRNYPAAADAYQVYLKAYPTGPDVGHVELLLGLVLSRYLNRPADAKEHLRTALEKVHSDRDRELATNELDRIRASER